jgi:methionyl-tRNA formyltransferase
MTEKPDNGDIVAQTAVPILADDTAMEVFTKVSVAAELTLVGALPGLIAGTAPRVPQDLSRGAYFGGRRPEDGVIDWSQSAASIHNLVRAVAPPYPGAMTSIHGRPARVLRTRVLDRASPPSSTPLLFVDDGRLCARCGGGGSLLVLDLEIDGAPVTADVFAEWCRQHSLPLPGRIDAPLPAQAPRQPATHT